MINMTKVLQFQNSLFTGRLELEKLNTDDYDFIKCLVNTKGWLENIGDRNVHSDDDAMKYINKILATENLFYWVVRIKNANTPIGIISFLKRRYLEYFDIGFAFLPYFNNNGYAHEAAHAVLSMVSKLPEFNIVQATTRTSNHHSIKLLTKLGFRFEKEIEIENENLHIYTNETQA
jgi:[ribosomal protein S5]-alanine N-acetyltransferase